MKLLGASLASLLNEPQMRQNVGVLLKYVALVLGTVIAFASVFHVIMYVEGQQHSWLTGVYWALTVMSTLGFGDITFHSDVGRGFSILVLLTGMVLLLVLLPFVFIRFFYAPWLEARVRLQAPTEVPPGTSGHVVICAYDNIAGGLIARLRLQNIPYYVIEPDPTVAARMEGDGIAVVAGVVESRATYEKLRVDQARLVLANREDTTNTNITLTVREVAPQVPVVAIVDAEDSIDILQLSGATHVMPLKKQLGEHLASRVNAGHAEAHVIGRFRDLLIAEFPVHKTPLVGRTIRETRLREAIGINVVAIWERGALLSATPETRLSDLSVAVVVGTAAQVAELNSLLVIYDTNYNPVLVIGGGKVGCATTLALKRGGLSVHLIEREETLRDRLASVPDRWFIGDAADRHVLLDAGLNEAPAVLLTTNDDAMNIYLAVYYRRLNPELRIISRITHERNFEAIHRAGADFALSYASLGAESVFAIVLDRASVVLGEGIDMFRVSLPESLEGCTLAESEIGARTGLNVIAVENDGEVTTAPPTSMQLLRGGELVMLGTAQQWQQFKETFSMTARPAAT